MSRQPIEPGAGRSDDASDHPRPILIVEDQAHVSRGHFPVLFADLARALHDRGHEVTVLTARGWTESARVASEPFDLRRLGRVALTAHRIAGMYRLVPRRLRASKHGWQDAVMTIAARRLGRRLGGADVIVTSYAVDPYVVSVFAGHGRWLQYQYALPGAVRRMASRPPRRRIRPIAPLARWAQRRRRQHGGQLRLVVNADRFRAGWQDVAPWLEPLKVPFTCSAPRQRIADARRQLRIEDGHCALVFGGAHAGKDHDVVWRAFDDLPDWQLIVGGTGMAQAYANRRSSHPAASGRFTVFKGFANDDMRALLCSAADLMVLSFQAGVDFDSGTLADAIAWGLPIVCSDQCYAGEIVARLGLGPVFESGNDAALASAVRSAPQALDAATRQRALDELSPQRMADQHLAALGRRCHDSSHV